MRSLRPTTLAVAVTAILVGCSVSSAGPMQPATDPLPEDAAPTLVGIAAAAGPGTWTIDSDALPAAGGRVFTAPGPDDGVYVLVVDSSHEPPPGGSGSRSVLALLTAAGRVRPGWPIAIAGWSCDAGGVEAWDPRVVDTGATFNQPVFLLCRSDGTDGSEPGSMRAFAFDASGRRVPGWPVDVSPAAVGGGSVIGSRVLNGGMSLLLSEADGWRLAWILWDGTLQVGEAYTAHQAWGTTGDGGSGPARLGPDGNGYLWHRRADGTEIASFGLAGPRTGWPVVVPETDVVDLVFGGRSAVCWVARLDGGSTTRVRCVRPNGDARYLASADVPVRVGVAYNGGGPNAYTVYVADEGSAWVFGTRGGRTLAYALDRVGRPRQGWPSVVSPGLQWQGSCGSGVTPCARWLAWPAAGAHPGYVLYLPQAAAGVKAGGRLVALARSGRVIPGWPVTLRRAGAQFWSVDVGSDGTIFALAIEPERDGDAATVLAITPAGKVRWRTTVVEP